MIYASILLFAAFWGLLWLMRRDTLKRGKTEAENKTLEAENEAIQSRPITDTDLLDSLRRKAANKPKDRS